MKKIGVILVWVLAGLLFAAAGGAAAWWFMKDGRGAEAGKPEAAALKAAAKPAAGELDSVEYKYVSLEKVIVMLRTAEGEPMSHYLSIDLVFKTAAANEKKTKEHLPLLRSLAVRALSSYTLDKASRMNIDQVARDLNLAFARSYAESRIEKPFSEAMIGKLIIE